MKILKEGRQQKGWAGEFTCSGYGNGMGGCGATLLVEQDDLYVTRLNTLHESELCKTFTCQACGVETDLPVGVGPPTNSLPNKQDWLTFHSRT